MLAFLDASAREDFSIFAQKAFTLIEPGNTYEHNWHLDCLSEHLMESYAGRLPWLIFTIPPRTLKSVWVAQLYPAWVIGKNPSHQFIGASYAHSLAERNVMKTRQAMTSDWYLRLFPETQISKDQNQKDYFTTTQAGQYKGTGIGGTITGYGCHCVSGDTLVTTSAGQRRIADLDAREGLQVMSYNHETGKAEWNNLLATKMTYRGDIVDVWIYGGISVRCTSDHPFYVVGKGYTPAEDLSRGDTVIIFPRADLETVCMATVNAVEEVSSKAQPVYDIQVENAHNFFANGILVHNSLIVDDPISPREAASDTVRKTAINEIRSTLFSRFNNRNDARFIMIMQRVHEDDPTGNLMRDSDGRFHLVKIPAEAKSQVVVELGERKWVMEPGELLTPRLGRKDLDELLLDLGPANYAGQYLQEPVPIGGGEFKPEWIQYYNPAKIRADKMNIVILVDPSGGDELRKKKKKTGDWSAYMVVGLGADKNYYLLDMVRDRLNPTERVDMLFVLHRKWSALGKKPPKVGYEKYGMMSDTHYIRQKQENESYRFPIIELGGSMMKEERIRRLIPDMHNGRWYFPEKLEYMDSEGRRFDLVKELVYSEMATFPRSRYDDMCLVAGTLIATAKGDVPIEDIRIGDLVLTPDGFKPVYDCGYTGTVETVGFENLEGTGSHPVFTLDCGYIPLDTLTRDNKLVESTLCGLIKTIPLKLLSSTELSSAGWEDAVNTIYHKQPTIKSGSALKACMLLFGSFIQARQYRKAMRFTIKTMILLTTVTKTWSIYRCASIAQCLRRKIESVQDGILTTLDLLRLHGTPATLAVNGIGNMHGGWPKRYLSSALTLAHSALRSLLPRNPELLCATAPICVVSDREPEPRRHPYHREILNACSAGKKSRTQAQKGSSAPHHVTQNTDTPTEKGQCVWREKSSACDAASQSLPSCPQRNTAAKNYVASQAKKVYNLSVSDAKCYFANGILVHNCDAISRVYTEDLMLLWPEGSMGSRDYSRSKNEDWFESVGNDSWLDF